MFRKLRLKLTLFNALITGLIFIIIISLTFICISMKTINQSEQLMQIMAADAGSNYTNQSIDHKEDIPSYFYVKINGNGDITSTSSYIPITNSKLELLIGKILMQSEQKGEINLNADEVFRFLKMPLSDGQSSVIVLVNIAYENGFLRILVIILIVAGVIGLALAFLGSLFMAKKALEPIKVSWQKQKDFIADASHELRTPLAVIQTNLDLVFGKPDETTLGSQKKWLQNAYHENRRMAKIVDDLLFLAETDNQTLFPEMKYFSLYEAVLNAVSPFEAVAALNNLHFELFLDPIMSFYGDERHLKQLVVILVDNAIKYTPIGGSVVIKLEDTKNQVTFSVSDTGEGIDRCYLEKVFDRFYRVDKARSRQNGGTGLGLAIAKWIVSEHKGMIKVDSIIGRGSTFSVNMPKIKDDLCIDPTTIRPKLFSPRPLTGRQRDGY